MSKILTDRQRQAPIELAIERRAEILRGNVSYGRAGDNQDAVDELTEAIEVLKIIVTVD